MSGTPIPYGEVLTQSTAFIEDFNLFPFIIAFAIAGLGTWLFRRVKAAAR